MPDYWDQSMILPTHHSTLRPAAYPLQPIQRVITGRRASGDFKIRSWCCTVIMFRCLTGDVKAIAQAHASRSTTPTSWNELRSSEKRSISAHLCSHPVQQDSVLTFCASLGSKEDFPPGIHTGNCYQRRDLTLLLDDSDNQLRLCRFPIPINVITT